MVAKRTFVSFFLVCAICGVCAEEYNEMVAFKFQIKGNAPDIWLKQVQIEADKVYAFGWVQRTKNNEIIGEFRGHAASWTPFYHFLQQNPEYNQVAVEKYPTKNIRLMFSYFRILDASYETPLTLKEAGIEV